MAALLGAQVGGGGSFDVAAVGEQAGQRERGLPIPQGIALPESFLGPAQLALLRERGAELDAVRRPSAG